MMSFARFVESTLWEAYVKAVQRDLRGGRTRGGIKTVPPASSATLRFGAAWLVAYRERKQ